MHTTGIRVSHIFRCVLLITGLVFGHGFPRAASGAEAKALPDDLQALIDTASGLPPEFAADILLRLAESGAIGDREALSELLRTALNSAPLAQEPLPLRALPGSQVDTDAGYRSRAFQAGLDSMSLRLRALTQIARDDPGEALTLYLETRLPRLARGEVRGRSRR